MAKRTPRDTGGGGGVDNRAPDIGPEQDPHFEQGGAPAGDFYGGDLPVRSVDAPPARYSGYSPSRTTHDLPPAGSDEGMQRKRK